MMCLLMAVTMMNVAHRGLWVEANVPQNTVEAIRAAYEAGAKVVETDFNETACGEMICLHDKRALLTMVKSFDKEVKDITPEDRATINLGEKAKLPRPYRIPTLDEVLAVVPKDRVLQSEIKLYGPGYADKFDAAVRRAGLTEKNITVSSFDLAALKDFHAKYPKYETIYLLNMRPQFDAALMISRCRSAGVRVMCPSCCGCRQCGFKPSEAEKIRQAGLEFRVFGVNDPESLRYAMSLGATGFTCNTFRKAYEWAKDIPGLTLLPDLAAEAPRRHGLPTALCGDSSEVRSLQMDVTTSERITVERYVGKIPALSQLPEYAAVVLGCEPASFGKDGLRDWTSDEGLAKLEAYVRDGGNVIVLSRMGAAFVKSAKGQALFGIKSFGNGAADAVRVTDAAGRPWLWQDALSLYARETLPGAETLTTVELKGGKTFPAAVRNAVGKGSFYWLSQSWSQYDMKFSAKKKVAGEADDKGIFVLTPDGEAQKALNDFLKGLLLGLAKIDTSAPPSTWGLKPLGEPGDLKLDNTFANRPEFRKAPVRKPGIRFCTADVNGVVVAPSSNGTLYARGGELAWHLSKMVGREVKLVKALPADPMVPAIVIGDAASCRAFGVDGANLKRGEAILKCSGERLLVYGRGSGLGFAMTYLLESLGCRYLWPGKTGKVIPKRAEIVLPEVDFDYVPAYKIRGMRDFKLSYRDTAGKDSIKEFWGIDPKEFGPVYEASLRDDRGNRDFWQWHGINDTRDVEGDYSWGHYFGHYWQKYGKGHPDWFALQPNGSREQELGNRPERPCLCVSNRGFIEQTAKDAIATFRKYPGRGSFSLCLPDGGYPSQCMCEGCRRWDPVNAPKNDFYVGTPWWRWFPYVSLSDRMMAFNNAVAELVEKECPGKKLGAYIYSMYEKPPVKVKPHPNLVLLSCAGSIASGGEQGAAAQNIAAWSRVAKQLLWRPNTLFAFSVSAPQNYARQMFEELELFKVNNVIGTDFDCVNGQFATKGLIFYAMTVAHRNPDHLSYDDVVADYCKAGFGRAADDVAAYFAALEEMTNAGIASKRGNNGFLASLDVEKLAKILDRAETAAADDAEVLARIAYLRRGTEAGRIEKKLGAAWDAKDRAGVKAAQQELRDFMKKTAFEEPAAVNPIWVTGTYHSPNMKPPNF